MNFSSKGKFNGNCNRSACLAPGANWFNISTRKFYCFFCARDITDFSKKAERQTEASVRSKEEGVLK